MFSLTKVKYLKCVFNNLKEYMLTLSIWIYNHCFYSIFLNHCFCLKDHCVSSKSVLLNHPLGLMFNSGFCAWFKQITSSMTPAWYEMRPSLISPSWHFKATYLYISSISDYIFHPCPILLIFQPCCSLFKFLKYVKKAI